MAVAKTLRAILLGVPPDPEHQPDAYELYQKLQEIEVQAALNGALYFEDTLAQLNAVSGAVTGDTGFVIDDGTSANNGVYRRGASTWAKTAELPGAFSDSLGAIAQLELLEASLGDLAYLDQVSGPQIADGAVSLPKLADRAEATFIGRAAGAGTGAPTQLSAAQASAILGLGDLAELDEVGTADIADNAVTNVKLADMDEARIKGRAAGSGTGNPQDLTASQARTAMGLGTAAVASADDFATASGLSDEITAREAADNLGDIIRLSSVTGTANAATGTVQAAQAHIAITGRQRIQSLWPTTNTAANPTLTIGATAYTIKRRDGSALAAGDLRGGAVYDFVLDPDAVNTLRLMGAVAVGDITGLQAALDSKFNVADVVDYAPIGGRVAGTPGYAHRVTRDGMIVATVDTGLGPCDVQVTVSGIGPALTTLPYELLSMSGQSNMLDGGDSLATNASVKFIKDFRCWREINHITWGDGDGSAPVYVDGDITGIVRAGFDTEFTWSGQFTADVINFSNVLIDQDMLRQQRVYVQMVSARGGTPLTEFMPERALGANITGYIDGTEDYLATLDIDTVMYAHFLVGHEDPTHTGFASYSALLSAFADHVCGEGAALAYNVAHGIRPKVLAYQPNDQIGAADGRTVSETAIDTLHCALTDPDVVCIGPIYHERTTDAGLHMIGKLMTAELYAHVYDIVRAGGDFVPLHISAASRIGNVITATLTGPAGFVMRDTDWLPLLATDGITFGDDSNSAFVTGVSFTNADAVTRTLTIALSTVPTGANKKLYIGGRNNASNPGRPGGMCSFYVPGRRSRWVAAGFGDWALPEIRHYLCRDIITIT